MKNSYTSILDGDADAVELEVLLPRQPAQRTPAGPISATPTPYETVLDMLRTTSAHLRHVLRSRTYRVQRSTSPSSPKYFVTSSGITKRIHFWTRRPRPRVRTLVILAVIIVVWTPIILLGLVIAYGGVPPDYSAVRKWERELPQHVWALSRVHLGGVSIIKTRGSEDSREKDAEDGRRYLRFPDHLWGHGLNNVLQEALLTSHLSHRALRSFVFEDFTWSHLPLPYTLYDFALRPTRVPLGAFVGGWVGGGGVSGSGSSQSHSVVKLKKRASGEQLGSAPMSTTRPAGDGSDGVGFDGVPASTSSVKLATTSTSTTISTSTRAAIEERRAVSAEYFEYVCPPSRRVEIWYGRDTQLAPSVYEPLSSQEDKEDVKSGDISVPPLPGNEASGTEIVEWWVRRLQQPDVRDEPCVVVREEERRVFDSNFFGSTRILPLFDELKHSPVLHGFAWSPLVQDALDRTVARFFGTNSTPSEADAGNTVARTSTPITATPSSDSVDSRITNPPTLTNPATKALSELSPSPTVPTIPGLLAVHLRRGDYKRHCLRLAEWRAGYMGFNRFESMLDRFDVEEHLRGYENSAAAASDLEKMDSQDESEESRRAKLLEERREAYYLVHCLPTISEVVQRLHDVREEYHRSLCAQRDQGCSEEYALQDVYVLTNGWPAFVDELRTALLADGWPRVVGTPQLEDSDVDCAPSLAAGGADQNALVTGRQTRLEAIDVPPGVGSGVLTREEKGVSVAVDMGFAERAEVFVGNGLIFEYRYVAHGERDARVF